jgi:hypothetical protein
LIQHEEGLIRQFYAYELGNALNTMSSSFEDNQSVQNTQKLIKIILQEEIARYEAMDDKTFNHVLERLMEERLKNMF